MVFGSAAARVSGHSQSWSTNYVQLVRMVFETLFTEENPRWGKDGTSILGLLTAGGSVTSFSDIGQTTIHNLAPSAFASNCL